MKLCLLALLSSVLLCGADLRLGIIGTDTSHATAFTQALNDNNSPDHVSGARVVIAYKGGSSDIPESAERVDKYASELRDKWGVQIVDSIAAMCPAVDGILLESVDGRTHFPQFREAAKCGKPIFVDKPLASTLTDALEIAKLGKQDRIPWFSSSTLRFSPVAEMKNPNLVSVMVWAPGPAEPHHELDLTWYGIHGVEMLYTIMGPGCQEVSRISSPSTEVITGKWKDGRLGTVHLERPYSKYGGIAFLPDQKIDFRPDVPVSYVPLVREIVTFMQTRVPPVPNSVTLEMFGFMYAAKSSMEHDSAAQKLPATPY
jgi:hypothetical protein